MRHSLFNLVFTITVLLCGLTSTSQAWDEVTYNNKKYVSIQSVKKFYRFANLTKSGNKVVLRNKSIKMEFKVNSQEVFMNNVKFIFSLPIAMSKGKVLVSQMDLLKLIDPVLRPSYINQNKSFTTVVIDAGHGGRDPGAVNQFGTEAGYNLKVALKLRKLLKASGLKVVMTRSNDTYLTLQERVRLANRYQNAIFVSIHFNAGGAGRAKGVETFTLSPKGVAHHGRGVKASDHRTLRGNYQDSENIALATAVHSSSLLKLRISDRGIKRARYSVLTTIKHPAILIEGGFLSNAQEARKIHKSSYQANLAMGIRDGVLKYRTALSYKAKSKATVRNR